MPRKDFNLKESISKTSYDLLEAILGANENISNFKIYEKYVTDIKANLMFLDYFIESIYNKVYIAEKQLYKFILLLSEITKMISSWYNSRIEKCFQK